LEHCIDYFNKQDKIDAFNDYNSEMLRSMANSLSTVLGGSEFPKSWQELLDYKPETRSAEDIKTDILGKLHSLGGK